jgi:hypothetical protein
MVNEAAFANSRRSISIETFCMTFNAKGSRMKRKNEALWMMLEWELAKTILRSGQG